MFDDFLAFIHKNDLINAEDRILLAVSGGIDSVIMAHLFAKSEYTFALAHCNFKLRGEEAEKDADFVKALADSLGVPCFLKTFETKKYAKAHGLSTQLAARQLRYHWFETLLQKEGYQRIATAHHINDSIETTLYNLAKGTAIRGMVGIPIRQGKIIRPLLYATRDEIEQYARQYDLNWREDSSNRENHYARNLIRNKIIPRLKEINPQLEETFKNTLMRLRSTMQLLEEEVRQFKAAHTVQQGVDLYIDKEALKGATVAVIDELLKEYQFNFSQVVEIKEGLDGTSKIFDSPDFRLNIDRQDVIISPLSLQQAENGLIQQDQHIFSNKLFTLEIKKKKAKGNLIYDKMVASLDYEKLNFPLIVRKWQDGDQFVPLGMKGKKKLSDFMIDNKIPLNLKERIYVLESAGDIVWVIGQRIDDRYKIRPETNRMLKVLLTYHD
ncbi:MAG: tRNA lysidine(34) synthetase TilS [Fulvivirga sp.]|nr:tRNA lysidine(34) synthetase TilS [Fulvivirga sp.]